MGRAAMIEVEGKKVRKTVVYKGWRKIRERRFPGPVIERALRVVDIRQAHLVHSEASH